MKIGDCIGMHDRIPNERNINRLMKPTYIILSHIPNLICRGTVYEPNMFLDSYKLSWPYIQKYTHETLLAEQAPCHNYIEFVEEDYLSFVGCSITHKSWYLTHLIKNGSISSQYTNSIIVFIGSDFSLEIPEKRLLKGLSHFILSPLMKLFGIGSQRVIYIDDILTPEAKDNCFYDENLLRRFLLKEAVYYDHTMLLTILKEYEK